MFCFYNRHRRGMKKIEKFIWITSYLKNKNLYTKSFDAAILATQELNELKQLHEDLEKELLSVSLNTSKNKIIILNILDDVFNKGE